MLIMDDLIHCLLIKLTEELTYDPGVEFRGLYRICNPGLVGVLTVYQQEMTVILGFNLVMGRAFLFILHLDVTVTI